MLCNVDHTIYETAQNRSLLKKLVDRDREAWKQVAPWLVVALFVAVWVPIALGSRKKSPAVESLSPLANDADDTVDHGEAVDAAPLVSLVGCRIRYLNDTYTVLDDNSPGVEAARRRGGRSFVQAVDSGGTVGLLFVGFDRTGSLVEAAHQASDWAAATLLG